ncbi:DUF5819 family protein [Paenibacillus alvei]|nr:DUF5819 family protein [Paenibacillus alvei]
MNMKFNCRQRMILIVIMFLVTYLLVSHFLLIFLYLSPVNPVKAAMKPYIQQYTQDLFAQNWSLFAPEPLHNNTALLVKCDVGKEKQSEWYNINYGMIQAFHEQPLGPFARLSRMHLTAIRYYQGFSDPTAELTRQKICEKDSDNPLCTREDEASKNYKEIGKKMLARLGSTACSQLSKQEANTVKNVKLRMLVTPVRPFSDRNNKEWKPEISGLETDWLPFEDVDPLSFKFTSLGGST